MKKNSIYSEQTVGSRINEYLKDNRISQQELSDKSGVSLSCVRNICNGKTKRIRVDTYYRICKGLHISADYFVFGQ